MGLGGRPGPAWVAPLDEGCNRACFVSWVESAKRAATGAPLISEVLHVV